MKGSDENSHIKSNVGHQSKLIETHLFTSKDESRDPNYILTTILVPKEKFKTELKLERLINGSNSSPYSGRNVYNSSSDNFR